MISLNSDNGNRPRLPLVASHWLSSGGQTILDLLVLTAALPVSYLLRFDFDIPATSLHNMLVQIPLVVLLQFVVLTLWGARGFIWRYTGMGHLRAFLYAALSSTAVIALLRLTFPEVRHAWRVPLSVNLIDCVLAFGGAFSVRVLRRAVYESQKRRGQLRESGQVERQSALLIGAGQAGVLAANEIRGRGDVNLEIRGFVDDDPMKQGRIVVQRHKVLGTIEDIPKLVHTLGIDQVVITIAQASREEIQRIVKICEETPIKVRIIPGLYEILDGRVEISRIRDVQIEDLLGREQVKLDVDSIRRELAGKRVLITGAGGSIGSELARQVIRFEPSELLLVERAEFALFHIDRSFKELDSDCRITPLVADVGDELRMRSIFERHQPQVVIHAAAHKHVPLMESCPKEAIKNNVFNTHLLGELAAAHHVEAFVLISTDKAVRPTSIMGASKRLAELAVQDLGRRSKTRFVAVRFGNVIGSNGSAVPIFQEQIRNGGPVTITDRRMQRYFMTIPEAAQLVLQASAIGMGGEVFILHMGELVNIMDLAETLIALSGLRPHQDIKIIETGIRPGEKLYEELVFESEETIATSHEKIFVCKIASLEHETLEKVFAQLRELVSRGNDSDLRLLLTQLLPEANLTLAASHRQSAEDAKAMSVLANTAAAHAVER